MQRLMRRGAPDFSTAIHDIDARTVGIYRRVAPYTMTNLLRVQALVASVEYVVHRCIPGAFAECGVWRGGSVMAMLLKLLELGVRDRDIYLYDTFEGMTRPDARDTSPYEPPALMTWLQAKATGREPWHGFFRRDYFNFEQVRAAILSTGYPEDRIHFVQGRVEDTVPATAPTALAVLRLDTDWYESTRHELVHLYPRLSAGGVLIVDDYGHWHGCRKAVDEYFGAGAAPPILLNRVDYAARLGIKT